MRLSHLILNFAALALAAAPSVHAADTGNAAVYVVTYFEVGAPMAAQAAALARQFADANRKAEGNTAFQVFEELGRPGRFAMLEAWRDKAAVDAHGAALTAFHDKLQPMLVSPFDSRPSTPLSIAPPLGRLGARTVYVVTHVDVVPANKDRAIELVKALAEASRKDSGNLWFDVLQQDSRPNHFTLVEAWHDRKAHDAAAMAAQTKDFRQQLTPLSGALYDERLYRAVR
jgi:quinol monooxygenase YgiN